MYIDTTFPPPDVRLAQVMRVFEALDRNTLAAAIERGIDRLDTLDGDPDEEDDDPAGGEIVDEPHDAEEDYGVDDKGEPGSWPEGGAYGTQSYADDEHEQDSPRIIAEFRDRIRRKRCRLERYGPRHLGWGRYVLDGPTPPCPIGIQA